MNFLFKEIFGLVFWIMALHRLNDFFCLFARRIGFGFDFCYRLNDFFYLLVGLDLVSQCSITVVADGS